MMCEDYTERRKVFPRRAMFQAWLEDSIALNNPTSLNKNNVDWVWQCPANETNFVDFLNEGRDVIFHRKHSSGTAIVRGSELMTQDQHYWEIQMISPVYGTDVMIGVGTPSTDMTQLHNSFVSRLGRDSNTWGFSYTGSFHHNGEGKLISSAFDQGSIIGMHLDMWKGTLSIYKNKKHLGITSRGLNGKSLYAMASSTAAHSSMRILQSCSFPSSLQFLCCVRLRDIIPDDKSVLEELPTPPGLRKFLENNLSWLLNPRLFEKHPCHPHSISRLRTAPYYPFPLPDSAQPRRPDPPRGTGERKMNVLLREDVGFQNCSRFLRRNAEPNIRESASSSTASNSPTVENVEGRPLDDADDSEDSVEVKRRKYSYNYAVGLSDPDSDSEL